MKQLQSSIPACPSSIAAGKRNPNSARVSFSPLARLLETCEEELQGLQDRDLFRTLITVDAIREATVRIEGRWLTAWCTNDYLGLSGHPRVVQAACEAAARWGVGSRASRLLAGSTQLHAQLEEQLASFFHADAALVFASGYLANLGTLGALLGRGDAVFIDRLAHASLLDACRLTNATLRVFRHCDVAHLTRLLQRHAHGRHRLVVTEGLFSMDGDLAPLDQLLEVVQAHGALLYVDDAHGAFASGATGRGSPEARGVAHESMIYMGTLGKALGCQGGFVIGPHSLIRFLQNRARTFLYATSLAVPVVAAALEALRLVEDDPTPRLRLARNVRHLHARLRGLQPLRALSPGYILPIPIGSSGRACEVSRRLWELGVFAPAIRPPTVPEGTARLRISLTALHTVPQLDELSDALSEVLGAGESPR